MAAPRPYGSLLEQSRRRALAVLLPLIALFGLLFLWRHGPPEVRPGEVETEGLAWPVPGGEGSVVTAEVLNGTERTGLARLGTRVLRSKGIDVIASGNARSPAATTRIVVRRATPDAGATVRRALGLGAVDTMLDSTRRVDVSVILGEDFTPVTPLHP